MVIRQQGENIIDHTLQGNLIDEGFHINLVGEPKLLQLYLRRWTGFWPISVETRLMLCLTLPIASYH